jgi:hypothetical protein
MLLHEFLASKKNLPTVKKEAAGSSETLVPMYQTVRRHVSEDSNIQASLRLEKRTFRFCGLHFAFLFGRSRVRIWDRTPDILADYSWISSRASQMYLEFSHDRFLPCPFSFIIH